MSVLFRDNKKGRLTGSSIFNLIRVVNKSLWSEWVHSRIKCCKSAVSPQMQCSVSDRPIPNLCDRKRPSHATYIVDVKCLLHIFRNHGLLGIFVWMFLYFMHVVELVYSAFQNSFSFSFSLLTRSVYV